MKKICILLGFLFASNAIAQQLNLNAVLSGNTPDVICYVVSAPGNAHVFQSINCQNKNGIGAGMGLGKQANEYAIIAGFVGSGRWDLATTYIGANNTTSFIFTRK